MARFKTKKVKDPFEVIPQEWKDTVASLSPDEINNRIAEVAKCEAENLRLKSEDPELTRAKEEAKELNAPYAELTKLNKLKIRYAMQKLEDKGAA